MGRSELWNIRIGLASTTVAALGVLASVLVYLHGLNASIEKEQALIDQRSQVEYQRKLWDERRQGYQALAATLGRIVAEIDVDRKISPEALKAFSKAYWGSLILVENEAVKSEMVKLKDDLRDLDNGRISSDKVKLRIERIVSQSKAHIDEVVDAQKP